MDKLRLINHGTKPSRAKVGTTQNSKDKYVANTLRAAGVTPAADFPQEANIVTDESQEVDENVEEAMEPELDVQQESSNRGWEFNSLLDYNALYDNEEGGFVDNPLAFAEDVANTQDDSIERK